MSVTTYVRDVELELISSRKDLLAEHSCAHNGSDGTLVMGGVGRDGAGDGVLTGRADGECCCRKQVVSGVVGSGYVHYACKERRVGACKWRMTQEPTVLCMFRATTNTKIGGRTVEISSCTRMEAQDEADRLYDEEAVAAKMREIATSRESLSTDFRP